MAFDMDIFKSAPSPTPAPRPKKPSSLAIYRLSPRPSSVPPRFSTEASRQEPLNVFRSPLTKPGGKTLKALVIDPNAASTPAIGDNSLFSESSSNLRNNGTSTPQQSTPTSVRRSNDRSAFNINGDGDDSFYHSRNENSHLNGDNENITIFKTVPSDYYLEPSLNQLRSMPVEDLKRIKNFKVGKADFGSVTFTGETDVRFLDIGKTILFSPRSVEVYPEGVEKPPVGSGLNKRSVITLENARPRAANRAAQFEQKLRKSCEEFGGKFISYDPSTALWTFEVQHFSIYGYDDSDEEDEEEVPRPPPQHRRIVIEDSSSEGDAEREEEASSWRRIDDEPSYRDQEQYSSDDEDLDYNRSDLEEENEMEEPYPPEDDFDEEEETQAPVSTLVQDMTDDPRIQLHSSILFGSKESKLSTVLGTPNQSFSLQGKKRRGSPLARSEPSPPSRMPLSKPKPIILSDFLPSNAKPLPTEIMETIDRVKTFSRSFRVSWGPDGRLVRPLADGRIEIHKVSFGLIRPTTEEEQKEEEKIHSCYVSLLKESNTVTKEKDGWDFVDKAIQKLSPAGTGTLTDQWMKRLQSVWKLIKILFAAAKQSHDLELHARYSALGSWLADYVSEKVHEEVNSGTDFQGVFCLLTGRRISEAAMKALESDDVASLRLATVIAQAASHDTRARDDVANWLKLKPELKDPDLRRSIPCSRVTSIR